MRYVMRCYVSSALRETICYTFDQLLRQPLPSSMFPKKPPIRFNNAIGDSPCCVFRPKLETFSGVSLAVLALLCVCLARYSARMVSMVASWSTSEVVRVGSLLAVEVVRALFIIEKG